MIYRYRVKTFDESENTYVYCAGFCNANSYCEAVGDLSEYYGENQIEEIEKLAVVGDSSIIQLAEGFQGCEELGEAEKVLDKYQKDFVW